MLAQMLRGRLSGGRLTIQFADGRTETFGAPVQGGPDLAVRVTDPALVWKAALGLELAFAEAYMDGRVVIERGSLHELIALFLTGAAGKGGPRRSSIPAPLRRKVARQIATSPLTARRHVAHHYDLGNAFYRLWLDRDLHYSCAYWPEGTATLEAAQTAKVAHIAKKLCLRPGMRVLDIGSGWGSLAIALARDHGATVTGVTLSKEQLALARDRAEQAGVSDRVTFELKDYRAVRGLFDRIVSVGMLEHVGARQFDAYFRTIHTLLKDEGIALVHAIGSVTPPGAPSPFLRKYIFPGGYVPSLSEIFGAVERVGLWPQDCEIWRLHYARTLRAWWDRVQASRGVIAEMYDARFVRMWELYLAACEATFTHGATMVFQIQLGRQRDAAPLTREYMSV